MSMPLQGTWTALYTPFRADGAIDESALTALCERQVAAGIGLAACGTTGETPTLDPNEYDLVVRTAVRVSKGRVPVMAGTGTNSTRTTLAMTRRARELGADAALVVTPYYNKPPQVSLLAHYRAVADGGGLPVVLYNVPGRTACALTAETILALAEHPQIIGVKEASQDLDLFQALISGAPEGFAVLSGDDTWTAAVLLLGAHGVVSVAGNVVPSQVASLVEAARRGDPEETRTLLARLLPLFHALFATTNPIPVKRAASLLGHGGSAVRLPLTEDAMDEAMVERLGRALAVARGAGEGL